jgi:hypothetical protein
MPRTPEMPVNCAGQVLPAFPSPATFIIPVLVLDFYRLSAQVCLWHSLAFLALVGIPGIRWHFWHWLAFLAFIGISGIRWHSWHSLAFLALIDISGIRWHSWHSLAFLAFVGIPGIRWHFWH